MLSSWELMALAVIALLVFGPDRLPGMARSVGKTLGRLRTEATSTIDELKRATEIEELKKAADVHELRDAADELRAEADELSKAASDGGSAQARQADRPAPFDPDAT